MFNINDLTDAASQYTKTAADLVGSGQNVYNAVTGKTSPPQTAQDVASGETSADKANTTNFILKTYGGWIIGAVVVAALAWFFLKEVTP